MIFQFLLHWAPCMMTIEGRFPCNYDNFFCGYFLRQFSLLREATQCRCVCSSVDSQIDSEFTESLFSHLSR